MSRSTRVTGCRWPDGSKIKRSKIRSVVSNGMICSTRELGLGEDQGGILVLAERLQTEGAIEPRHGGEDGAAPPARRLERGAGALDQEERALQKDVAATPVGSEDDEPRQVLGNLGPRVVEGDGPRLETASTEGLDQVRRQLGALVGNPQDRAGS